MNAEKLLSALVGLGESSADVANALWALHLRGIRLHGCFCPVAAFVRRLLEAEGSLTPGVKITAGPDHVLIDNLSVKTPEAVAAFMVDFDAGMYPSLILGAKP